MLFDDGCHDWLARIDSLAIERHNSAARQKVLEAISRHPFEVTKHGETIFCFRQTERLQPRNM